MSEKSIFKKIIDGEIPAERIYEDEHCLAIHDIAPQAPVHFLVIPKKEIRNIADLHDDDRELIGHLFGVIRDLAKAENVDGYRVITNCGESAGQTVFHLHFHVLAGKQQDWP